MVLLLSKDRGPLATHLSTTIPSTKAITQGKIFTPSRVTRKGAFSTEVLRKRVEGNLGASDWIEKGTERDLEDVIVEGECEWEKSQSAAKTSRGADLLRDENSSFDIEQNPGDRSV